MVILLEENQLWETLFSDFFYFFPTNPTDPPIVHFREQIFTFIGFFSTMENHDNTEGCRKLLEVLQSVTDHSRQASLSNLLVRILRYSRSLVFLNLDALTIISGLIERQRKEALTVSSQDLKNARVASLVFLVELLHSNEAAPLALPLKDILFQLLRDPNPSIQSLALTGLVALLRLPFPNSHDAMLLYSQYLEMLNQ